MGLAILAHKSLLWSRVIKAIHGPEGGLITDVRRGFRSTWTSIVQEVKKLQNQGVNIFDYIRIKIGNGDNTSFWKDKMAYEGGSVRMYYLVRYWSLENSGEFSVKSIRQVIDANCFPVIHSATRWVKSVPLKLARKISSWWNVDYVDVSSYEEWYTWLISLRLQANLKRGSGVCSNWASLLFMVVGLDVRTRFFSEKEYELISIRGMALKGLFDTVPTFKEGIWLKPALRATVRLHFCRETVKVKKPEVMELAVAIDDNDVI
ncbi:hypothetical protein Tco_0456438 [Tanacetum coccineum]